MSELKAYIGPAPDEKGLADYYLKSEADKVIAEKDKEIAELKGDNERLRGESCKLTDGCLRLKQCRKEKANIADELRHQKRERCLAMATFCHVSSVLCEGPASLFYRRWFHKWYELAERFKEGK